MTSPWIFKSRPASPRAFSKFPNCSVKAVIKRLPKLWPLKVPFANLKLNISDNVSGAFESATSAGRTEPGGSIPNSSRRILVDPPSSAIETMAVRFTGYSFNPESTVYVPVPPPITTTFFRFIPYEINFYYVSYYLFAPYVIVGISYGIHSSYLASKTPVLQSSKEKHWVSTKV